MKGAFLSALFAAASEAFSISLPEKRQANSAIAANAFRRRAYGSSAVLDGWLYLDGGEFSYASGSAIVYNYASTLLAVDLSRSWTNSTVDIKSISKPSGAPDLINAGSIWVDTAKKRLLTGFAGKESNFGNRAWQDYGLWEFTPNGNGGGKWNNLNGTADTAFVDGVRPFHVESGSGNGVGYMMGGWVINPANTSQPRYPITGLVSYNFETNTYTNNSVTGVTNQGLLQQGGMHFVPNFGPQGVLVTFGGNQVSDAGADRLVGTDTVQIYDPATGEWHEQTTTGDVPPPRKEFCMSGAASNNNTYEILMYAGWGGNLGERAIPFDEAYVLSLPSFNWFRADYLAENPRHAVTCSHIGGGQIATMGGVNTTQNGPDDLYKDVFNTQDQFTQGLAVFDLSTMGFSNGYSSTQKAYRPAPIVRDYYASNPRTPTFDSDALGQLMSVQNFTAAAVDSPNGNGNTGSGSGSGSGSVDFAGSDDSGTPVGAIVGGVVGGVAALALIGFAVWFILRRRRNAATKTAEMDGTVTAGAGAKDSAFAGAYAPEMPGREKYEMPDSSRVPTSVRYAKVAQDGPPVPHEMPADTRQDRHELA